MRLKLGPQHLPVATPRVKVPRLAARQLRTLALGRAARLASESADKESVCLVHCGSGEDEWLGGCGKGGRKCGLIP